MTRSKLPKSIRKYIREEKARIRRAGTDTKERARQIEELVKRYLPSRA